MTFLPCVHLTRVTWTSGYGGALLHSCCKILNVPVVRFSSLEGTITMFRGEAILALACFHVVPLSWSNWNLEMLVFVEGGKPEYLEKNPRSKARTNNKLLNPHMTPGRNQTQPTAVRDQHPHHCAIPVLNERNLNSLE